MFNYLGVDDYLEYINLARLWDQIPWERREDSPRYECWYALDGRPYTYGKGRGERTYQSKRLEYRTNIIDNIWEYVELLTNNKFQGLFINGYKDGSDHLGWHSDDGPDINQSSPIAVVSFGAERQIWLRPILDPEDPEMNKHAVVSDKFKLEHGSLFVMEADCQQNYQHRIPKADFQPCGPRISFTFRGLN